MYISLGDWVVPGDGRMFWRGLAALWIFSAAVSALSPPGEESGQAYRWLFAFSHLLAANLDKVVVLATPTPRGDSGAVQVDAANGSGKA